MKPHTRSAAPSMLGRWGQTLSWTIAMLLVFLPLCDVDGGAKVSAAEQESSQTVVNKVYPIGVSSPAAAMRTAPAITPQTMKTVPEGGPSKPGPPPPKNPIADPVIQLTPKPMTPESGLPQPAAEEVEAPEPLTPVDTLSEPDVNEPGITSCSNPPDTVGDVGLNHYIQMVNATTYEIFDKQGNSLSGPQSFADFWLNLGANPGDTCTHNNGDPIVVYDHLADQGGRWLMMQMDWADKDNGPWYMCFAISQTGDPMGDWWVYNGVSTPGLPDYPKVGVWPDAYYISTNEAALGVYAMERAAMLTGSPVTVFRTEIPKQSEPGVRDTRILPADLDGPPPPGGTPGFFAVTVDDQQDSGTSDRIEIYEAVVDWGTPSFTFTLADTLTTAPFQIMLCDRSSSGDPDLWFRDCIPQPDTDSSLDALSNRPMMQLKYRNFGTHQSMVINQAINVQGSLGAALEVAGIRWYELRKPFPVPSSWSIYQQGTYSPQPGGATEAQFLHRWMGSVAMDRQGNMALGYSIVNDDDTNGSEVYPGIAYTGRRFNDPLGTMPQGEFFIREGTESQTGGIGRRWGDYSAMTVDPADDCTFWYTQHVAGQGGAGCRPTQIASFRFPSCVATDVAVTKDESIDPVVAGNNLTYVVTVTNNGPFDAHNLTIEEKLFLAGGVNVVEPLTATAGTVSGTSPNYAWTIPLLPSGESATLTVVLAVHAAAAAGTDVISNTATLTAMDETDTVPDNDTVTVATSIVREIDLEVAKDESIDPAIAGTGPGNLTHTVTVTNHGPSTATGVTLSEVVSLPVGTTIVSITPSGATTYAPPNSAPGVWTVGNMLLDASETLVVVYDVGPSTMPGTDIVSDTATVTAANESLIETGDDSATEATSVLSPSDVSATKVKVGGSLIGETITYVIELTNAGPADQFDNAGPEFVDVLPDKLQLLGATADSGVVSLDSAANTVQWNGVVPVNGTVGIEIKARIISTGWVINQADILYDESGDGSNDGARLSDDPNEPGDADATKFYATAPVPILNGWGLALMLLLMAAAGIFYIKRKERIA